ncbi:MAG TPA: ABC transporter permease [Rhodospirillales bacterium]|nr:ABC transporter permease [Rhodospirillales bacterium]HIA81222.1 ABC transporter permease [Rhodospirillales bacterium]HIC58507.1 ABC transporter permease [Rhodospirillales bacterium]HIN75324.1 ABC transporter permease [Rhodospirillales bacterium]HIO38009.1 ABC transporter permease [Rhodospirillales bacterium]
MIPDWLTPTILTVVTASTPLVFAAIGEIVAEKAGVLNLGIEGMMIVGAIAAFAVGVTTGSAALAILGGATAGIGMALIFGILTLNLMANQVATGLALTLFGLGLSALIGHSYVGIPFSGLPLLQIPFLSGLPLIGPIIFGQDIMFYLSVASVVLVSILLNKTRWGLLLRAVGENHDAAYSIGYSVNFIRMMAVLFGGAMAGLGGAYLSLAYTPLWAENMTAGRGWIALALVVFASWKPTRAFLGAYLFGGITIVQLHGQALGIAVAPQVMSMLPYLATIIVLVLISRDTSKVLLKAPACLGRSFNKQG